MCKRIVNHTCAFGLGRKYCILYKCVCKRKDYVQEKSIYKHVQGNMSFDACAFGWGRGREGIVTECMGCVVGHPGPLVLPQGESFFSLDGGGDGVELRAEAPHLSVDLLGAIEYLRIVFMDNGLGDNRSLDALGPFVRLTTFSQH